MDGPKCGGMFEVCGRRGGTRTSLVVLRGRDVSRDGPLAVFRPACA